MLATVLPIDPNSPYVASLLELCPVIGTLVDADNEAPELDVNCMVASQVEPATGALGPARCCLVIGLVLSLR